MLQCDFCYMIGPDMFDDLVKPELAAMCAKLTNGFYHLDGTGQLPHLDSLLQIEELKGVQWVPGEGGKPWAEWPEVYRKIRDAGKRAQVWGPIGDFDKLVESLGSAEGLIAFIDVPPEEEPEALELLGKYGIGTPR
jgi:5-methyltetrahydrofolate--homocysteine methyltransferase